MHARGRADLSTFRRTLAAALRDPLGLTVEDDPRLDDWIDQHLSVVTLPVDDPDMRSAFEELLAGRQGEGGAGGAHRRRGADQALSQRRRRDEERGSRARRVQSEDGLQHERGAHPRRHDRVRAHERPPRSFALGSGLCLPTLGNAAVHRVTEDDAGLASGLQQALQQIGGAVGLAVLVTLALRAAGDAVTTGTDPAAAITDGYVLALRVGTSVLVLATVLAAVLLRPGVGRGALPAVVAH